MQKRSDEEIDELVDDAMNEAAEMDADFNGWIMRRAPRWHELGRDETWIRNRVQVIQAVRNFNHMLIERGLPEEQRRTLLRFAFTDGPLPFEK
jgi:hypothetical protein